MAYRVRPGFRRQVHYVKSSPANQLQPKTLTIAYAKPGDVLDLEKPVLVDDRKEIVIDYSLFPNPFELARPHPVWSKDGLAFPFECNQRGHPAYRVSEAGRRWGKARPIVDEESKTFFCYSGKKYRHDINDGKKLIWRSERGDWNHLYLYDAATGKVTNQITKGNWVVRSVDLVDDDKQQIWFRASGMLPGKDPYFC
jgi:hypothetical protein